MMTMSVAAQSTDCAFSLCILAERSIIATDGRLISFVGGLEDDSSSSHEAILLLPCSLATE